MSGFYSEPSTIRRLADTLTSHAVNHGSDGATERLLLALDAQIRAIRGKDQLIALYHELQRMAVEVNSAATGVPMVGRVLANLAGHRLADGADAFDSSSEITRESLLSRIGLLISDLHRARQQAALNAANLIGPNSTVCLLGVGERHLALAVALTRQYGDRFRIAVCSFGKPSTGDQRNRPSKHELAHHLKTTLRTDSLPLIEVAEHQDAVLAVSQADWIFLLTAGIGRNGQLVVPPGAEVVYHSALAYGKDVGILASATDVSAVDGVPLDNVAYTVLQPTTWVRVFSDEEVSPLVAFGGVQLEVDTRFIARDIGLTSKESSLSFSEDERNHLPYRYGGMTNDYV